MLLDTWMQVNNPWLMKAVLSYLFYDVLICSESSVTRILRSLALSRCQFVPQKPSLFRTGDLPPLYHAKNRNKEKV